jgi:IS30 family transposase
LKAGGLGVRAIAQALGRSPATISRELRRNALASGAYRPRIAEGSYRLRRQRPAVLERDPTLAGYVTDRLAEGRTPEQIAGRLKRGVERGLRYVSTETIYAWILRPGQKVARLWCYLALSLSGIGSKASWPLRGKTAAETIAAQSASASSHPSKPSSPNLAETSISAFIVMLCFAPEYTPRMTG